MADSIFGKNDVLSVIAAFACQGDDNRRSFNLVCSKFRYLWLACVLHTTRHRNTAMTHFAKTCRINAYCLCLKATYSIRKQEMSKEVLSGQYTSMILQFNQGHFDALLMSNKVFGIDKLLFAQWLYAEHVMGEMAHMIVLGCYEHPILFKRALQNFRARINHGSIYYTSLIRIMSSIVAVQDSDGSNLVSVLSEFQDYFKCDCFIEATVLLELAINTKCKYFDKIVPFVMIVDRRCMEYAIHYGIFETCPLGFTLMLEQYYLSDSMNHYITLGYVAQITNNEPFLQCYIRTGMKNPLFLAGYLRRAGLQTLCKVLKMNLFNPCEPAYMIDLVNGRSISLLKATIVNSGLEATYAFILILESEHFDVKNHLRLISSCLKRKLYDKLGGFIGHKSAKIQPTRLKILHMLMEHRCTLKDPSHIKTCYELIDLIKEDNQSHEHNEYIEVVSDRPEKKRHLDKNIQFE